MTVPMKTKWLGIRTADPSTDELTNTGEGSWWYRSDLKRWRWYDGTEIKDLPITIKEATTADITIPIGGGSATVSLTTADFGLSSRIDYILDLKVEREVPIVDDVYAPSYGINATGDAIGITLAAGTGTTLRAAAVVLGV